MNAVPLGGSPWYAGLTPRHWGIAAISAGCRRPRIARADPRGITHAPMIMGTVLIIGLAVPWFRPATVGPPLRSEARPRVARERLPERPDGSARLVRPVPRQLTAKPR